MLKRSWKSSSMNARPNIGCGETLASSKPQNIRLRMPRLQMHTRLRRLQRLQANDDQKQNVPELPKICPVFCEDTIPEMLVRERLRKKATRDAKPIVSRTTNERNIACIGDLGIL